MTVLYADSSALVRAYFADEPDHDELRELLLRKRQNVLSSEIARLEHASAVAAAAGSGRIRQPWGWLRKFQFDSAPRGALSLIPLRADADLPAALEIIVEHGLRSLDALHIAVALGAGRSIAGDEGLVFVTRDDDQALAARAEGLEVT